MALVQMRDSVADLKILAEAARFSRQSLESSAEWQRKADLDLENLATFKSFYASIIESKRFGERKLSIPASHIRLLEEKGQSKEHPEALFSPSKEYSRTVWISWQIHDAPEEEIDGATVRSPIEELAALLAAPKPDEFCVPLCLGYCNLALDEDQQLGLVFESPSHSDPRKPPVSLLTALKTIPKPSLTRRVALAHKISQCLMYLHSVNWLHKGLRSEKILFFPSSDAEDDLVAPYLTGFGFSRRARFNEATSYVPRVGSMEVYRHPDIQMNGPRLYYRKTFDIYSLGIILIEIAHWRPIASIVAIEDSIERFPSATSDIRQRWLELEPLLHNTLRAEIGERYAGAVRTCIAGRDSFGIAKSDLETSTSTSMVIQQGFNAKVVKSLHEIVV